MTSCSFFPRWWLPSALRFFRFLISWMIITMVDIPRATEGYVLQARVPWRSRWWTSWKTWTVHLWWININKAASKIVHLVCCSISSHSLEDVLGRGHVPFCGDHVLFSFLYVLTFQVLCLMTILFFFTDNRSRSPSLTKPSRMQVCLWTFPRPNSCKVLCKFKRNHPHEPGTLWKTLTSASCTIISVQQVVMQQVHAEQDCFFWNFGWRNACTLLKLLGWRLRTRNSIIPNQSSICSLYSFWHDKVDRHAHVVHSNGFLTLCRRHGYRFCASTWSWIHRNIHLCRPLIMQDEFRTTGSCWFQVVWIDKQLTVQDLQKTSGAWSWWAVLLWMIW